MSPQDLTYEEVESTVNEINAGGRVVGVLNGAGKLVYVFLSHCSSNEKLLASAVYDEAYNKAISEGFLTVEETETNLLERGIFTVEDEEKIESLRSKVEGQEKLLEKTTRVPARRDRIKKNIDILNKQINDILTKKEEFLEHTAERKANEEKLLFLCWRGVKDPITKELIWNTKEDFNKERDLVFRRNVFVEHIKLSLGIEPSVLRFVARHSLWRIRYNTSVNTGVSLFGIELPDYSVDQLALAYWSYYYQSIYEMLPDERPSDGVIEDDAALDAFMKSYMEEQNREAAAAKGNKNNKSGTKSAWDHGDVIVTKSNDLYQDIDYSPTVENIKNKGKNTVAIRDKGRKIQ